MGLFKKKTVTKTYDKENKKPVIKASICNGEQVAGFKDIHTGKIEEVMLIKNQADLDAFKKMYEIDGAIHRAAEPELLANCYFNSMKLAMDNVIRSIAFPSISTGVYSFPEASLLLPLCNELFTPTFVQYTMGMHIVSTRYLKCPHCKTRTWCKKVMTKE